ncbi:hypothetical protein N7478_000115 [Penicillium angulare]|uniref:uncharacterized protein n=1 Tax=Penicillium angulare TaxID=116970 RepID=UPI002541A9AC|nr:uncharacterized protein N7478_000115 [Penicillium angulare]KAJ5290864.1 hypothetical protein N7478_000115 [Penicillium angulare]
MAAKPLPIQVDARVSVSLYEKAYRRFNYDFISPFPGALSKLPQLLFENAPDSCLYSAVAAVAYANYHSRCQSEEAKEAGNVSYGETLQKFAAKMADPIEVQRDDNLMVIFLMSMYEMLTSSKRDGSYLAHMHGTQSVIAQRDGTTLQDGNNHLALLCTHMIVWYITDLKIPPAHLASWVQQIPFDSPMKKKLTELMSTTAVICVRLNERANGKVAPGPDSIDSGLLDLDEALRMESQLHEWSANLPRGWRPVDRKPLSHTNRPDWSKKLLTVPGAPDHFRTYDNPSAASDWNMCRAIRIHLWIQILKFLFQCDVSRIDVSEIKVRGLSLLVTLIDEIAETIPYSINLTQDGSLDPKSPQHVPGLYAYCILWSTYTSFVAYQSTLMKEPGYKHRVMWFGAMLRFLRDTTGIAKVEVMIEHNLTEVS